MLSMFLIISTICAAIAVAAFIASRNQLMKHHQGAIVMGSMFAVTGVIVTGIFAYNPESVPDQNTVSREIAELEPTAAVTTVAPTNTLAKTDIANAPKRVEPLAETAVLRTPGDVFKDCATCPEMVVVPSGDNDVGEEENTPGAQENEYPMVWVRFAEPFAVARFEIQVAEFKAFAKATAFVPSGPCNTDGVGGKNANYMNPGLDQKPDHPVVCVSFEDATRYAAWLTEQTGKTYSVMSEAQWEYARRSETSVSQPSASTNDDILPEKGNVRGENWIASTQDVGRFHANQFLLFDMMGNAAEWTSDCWQENHAYQPKDGSAVQQRGDCNARAVRGGSWDENASAARPASRRKVAKDLRDWRIGFRVMRTLKNTTQTSQIAN